VRGRRKTAEDLTKKKRRDVSSSLKSRSERPAFLSHVRRIVCGMLRHFGKIEKYAKHTKKK